MGLKASFVVGVGADNSVHSLYIGPDAQAAKDVYAKAVNGEFPGVSHVKLYLRPEADRRRDIPAPKPVAAPAPTAEVRRSKKLIP